MATYIRNKIVDKKKDVKLDSKLKGGRNDGSKIKEYY